MRLCPKHNVKPVEDVAVAQYASRCNVCIEAEIMQSALSTKHRLTRTVSVFCVAEFIRSLKPSIISTSCYLIIGRSFPPATGNSHTTGRVSNFRPCCSDSRPAPLGARSQRPMQRNSRDEAPLPPRGSPQGDALSLCNPLGSVRFITEIVFSGFHTSCFTRLKMVKQGVDTGHTGSMALTAYNAVSKVNNRQDLKTRSQDILSTFCFSHKQAIKSQVASDHIVNTVIYIKSKYGCRTCADRVMKQNPFRPSIEADTLSRPPEKEHFQDIRLQRNPDAWNS
ncbi:hypothetical protein CAPTEDRAFT_204991 [Capitella teleta]|uniref:Uncharacterized protein n=1 Tax=Capitella teleta TaxID=283909 RepID=R7UR06_CAPTE|nr:hypothetical protein CAPTEDRAFT_204991 [Capitella teleta]|eukprot:ELU06372.1 hypothetical protein CAPTEDRAFT_204991 [Capitella teleta]